MSDIARDPVRDWATDFDHTHPDYADAAPEIWDRLRSECPVAHSDRFGGVWLPTRHDDVRSIAGDTEHFSSQGVIVTEFRPDIPAPMGYAPPITSDPPFHADARKLLLEAFSPKAIRDLEPFTRQVCRDLLDALLADGATTADAARQYSQHIPVRVIAHMLGVPASDGDKFRVWIHRILENAGQNDPVEYEDTIDYYIEQLIAERRRDPGDDLVSYLIAAELDGAPLSDEHIRGTIGLLIIAGIDTTWSAIGASLWHLAQHPEHRRQLRDEPEIWPFAIEELLRAYGPVTMARLVAEDIDFAGCPMKKGDWVLLPFPAANRDPEVFDQADEVILDRKQNRHSAFGLGIHRCVGSNLARMELTVALEEWTARVPEFELRDPQTVTWSTGQVRGPRDLPVSILETAGAAGGEG